MATPSIHDAERIRAAVEKNPRKMTLQLARDLGVPEVEVILSWFSLNWKIAGLG